MRAGKLDHIIQLRRPTLIDDGWGQMVPGGPTETYATMRGQLIQSSTEEFIRNWGISDETAVIFRLRHIDIVQLADEVRCDGVESYCLAVANMRQAEAIIAKDGPTYISPTGELKRHPATTLVKEAVEASRRLAAELGLTPASRTKNSGGAPGEGEANEFGVDI